MLKKMTGKNYIQGKWVVGADTPFQSVDPGTEELLLDVKSASSQQVHAAVLAAQSCFKSWKKEPFEKRAAIALQFTELVDKHKLELATLISQEMGKPLWDSLLEVDAMRRKVAVSIKAYQERCAAKTIHELHVSYRPFGPVAVLGPYNFPAHLPHGQIIPAILAGNTIIFKPSELTPAVGEACVRLWYEAGLPENVLQLVQGGKGVGTALIDSKELRGVYFTGSASTGKTIESHALQFPHRICALEMGGNNPLIISKTENIEAAVFITIQSAFISSGQRCSCARRLIVINQSANFMDALVEKTKKLRIGHYTASPEPYMGPLVSKEAAHRIFNQYNQLQCRKILAPMDQPNPDLGFLTPGIIDVTGCTVPDEEIFGPILLVTHVENLEQAIIEANNSRFGLTAGIITDDDYEAQYALVELEAGIINCNTPLTGASSEAPFGGIKDSGNCRPAGYLACDFTAYPVASMIHLKPQLPKILPIGLQSG